MKRWINHADHKVCPFGELHSKKSLFSRTSNYGHNKFAELHGRSIFYHNSWPFAVAELQNIFSWWRIARNAALHKSYTWGIRDCVHVRAPLEWKLYLSWISSFSIVILICSFIALHFVAASLLRSRFWGCHATLPCILTRPTVSPEHCKVRNIKYTIYPEIFWEEKGVRIKYWMNEQSYLIFFTFIYPLKLGLIQLASSI